MKKISISFVIIWVLPKDFPPLFMAGYATDLSHTCIYIYIYIYIYSFTARVPCAVYYWEFLGIRTSGFGQFGTCGPKFVGHNFKGD
jgi:hypothetical protein